MSFCEKYVVTDYIEHVTDIEMRTDKRQTDNDRKHAERYNKNTMALTVKISITETSCHPLE